MKELVKFELKKIFSNKLIYIVASVIAAFILTSSIFEYKEIKDIYDGREGVEDLVEKYREMNLTKEEYIRLFNKVNNKYNEGENLTKNEEFILTYLKEYYRINDEAQVGIDYTYYNVDSLTDKLKELKVNNLENTYEYKDLELAKNMLSELEDPKSEYMGSWRNVLDLNVAATMKVILIVIGLSTIFTREYSSKVAYINLSSKNGKTMLNRAKIIAAFIYLTVVFIFVTIIYQISAFPLGMPNGDLALNTFMNEAIYNITVNEYYILSLVVSYLGTLIFGMITILLSLLTRNVLVSFGLPLAIFLFSGTIKLPEVIMNYTSKLNFAQLIRAKEVFNTYITFNVFGKPVLYPYLIIGLSVIALIIFLIIYKIYSKKQVIL